MAADAMILLVEGARYFVFVGH